ncbi:MAG: hypothetical protein V2I40_11580 [Desulfobacteraceae bacterium]|nr:hypothetical protein [Desulfobacteraceae bacterium]
MEILGWIEPGQGIIGDPDAVAAFFLTPFNNPEKIAKRFTAGLQAFLNLNVFVSPCVWHASPFFSAVVKKTKYKRAVLIYNHRTTASIFGIERHNERCPDVDPLAARGIMLTIITIQIARQIRGKTTKSIRMLK